MDLGSQNCTDFGESKFDVFGRLRGLKRGFRLMPWGDYEIPSPLGSAVENADASGFGFSKSPHKMSLNPRFRPLERPKTSKLDSRKSELDSTAV